MKKSSNSLSARNICFRLFLLIMIAVCFASPGQSQTKDSLSGNKVPYPNVVKLSLTNYAIYSNSLHMGYERVIGKHKSIYIFGGYNEFPGKLSLNLTGTSLSNEMSKSGYMMGAEFRFYLPKENKYDAPHGLYLAPYISYYHFNSDRTLTHTDSSSGTSQSVSLSMGIGLFNIGGMLGYQFVVFKRFVIDAELLGPSLTFYGFEANLHGQLNGIDPNGTLAAVLEAMKNKFPLLNDLSSGKTIIKSGVANSDFSFIGFRYSISIGFMF